MANATSGSVTTGNVLNWSASGPVSVYRIRNFDSINISVPSLKAEYRTTPYLTITDASGTDFSGTQLSVSVLSVESGLAVASGDRFTLLTNPNGLTLGTYSMDISGITDASQLLAYDAAAVYENNALDVVFTGGSRATEQSGALSEAHAAGGAFVLSGADMVAGPGMRAARQALMDREESPYGLAIFAAASGSSMRWNTDSHIDMRSFNLLTGPVLGVDTGAGLLSLGAFFEFGTGWYGVEHDMSGPEINGDGGLSYTGGGVLARMDFEDAGPGRFHVEGSARAGTLTNGFESSDARLRSADGRELDYDMTMACQSLHGGLGWIWHVTDNMDLDFFGEYLWTRMFSDSDMTSTGAMVEYDDFTSSRTRLGARLTGTGCSDFRPYVGAAWEYEFDGEARVSVWDTEVDSTDLSGSSFRGELGLTWNAKGSPFTVDFNMQGYAGKREGVSGNLLLEYRF